MMKKYKVIWFDDQHTFLNIIKEKAILNGIRLIGFDNAKDGIEELEKRILDYDAAIVDGLFLKKPGQPVDTVNDNALLDVARALERLSMKKLLPWFILSGQISFTKEKNRYADGFKGNKVYDKTNDHDLENLWNDLKSEADAQVTTQTRFTFSSVFEVCTDKYIGDLAANHLLAILTKTKENLPFAFDDPDLYFNPLRKILEDVFTCLNNYGFLPDVFVHPNVSFGESRRFLSGLPEKGYKLTEPVFTKVVSTLVEIILNIVQPGSHRSDIDFHIKQLNSPYILISITYQLMDVLLWLKFYIDIHADIEMNKTLVIQVSDSIETGYIEKDVNGNYHCGNLILTYTHINENNLQVGDQIRILKSSENSNYRTNRQYPRSVINSEKI